MCDFVGERQADNPKRYNNFNGTQECYGQFYFCLIRLRCAFTGVKSLTFHVNRLLDIRFTWNVKAYFLLKDNFNAW